MYSYKSTDTDASDDLLDAILARTHYSVYLLSWYKSTNTDASDDLLDAILERAILTALTKGVHLNVPPQLQVLSLLALLVQKYEY